MAAIPTAATDKSWEKEGSPVEAERAEHSRQAGTLSQVMDAEVESVEVLERGHT